MDKDRQKYYGTKIENMLEDIKTSIEYLKESTKPIAPSVSLGRLTRMEALSEKGVNEAMLSQNKQRLVRLGNALNRVEQRTYGSCLRCHKDVPEGRLDMLPEAVLCVLCIEKK